MRFTGLIGVLGLGLLVSLLAGLMLGPAALSPLDVGRIIASSLPGIGPSIKADFTPVQALIIWDVRLPRVLLGALTGAGLALAGAAIQALIRNALADPYILGVSSG